jgi:bacteriorhodopsin
VTAASLASACAFLLACGCVLLMLARVARPCDRSTWAALGALAEFALWATAFASFLAMACALAAYPGA